MRKKGLINVVADLFFGSNENLDPSARTYTGTWGNSYVVRYDGEKNLGEVGPVVEYDLDMEALRARSYKSFLDSEVTQTVLKSFARWIVGKGLKLQAEPVMEVLNDEGIDFNKAAFNKSVKSRFALFSKSKSAHIGGQFSLNRLAYDAFINSKIGGDVLVILRVKNRRVKVELVDGSHVCTPWSSLGSYDKVRNGVEYNKDGTVKGYWIKKFENGTHTGFQFIQAEVAGRKMAYLVSGLRYRLDDNRAVPLIVAVIETIAKMERYKEATVGSAEEIAKIAYQVVHQNYSTGENPMAGALAKAFDADANQNGDGISVDEAGRQLADQVMSTTNKQAYNNPIGAKIEAMTAGNKELYFKDFYTVNIMLVCATLGIPMEIALQKYDSNFSASRAALKDWESNMAVERSWFSEDFYGPIYALWLDIQVIEGKVKAPGYIKALNEADLDVLEAYRNSRFIGIGVPHIDPKKEVDAVRAKLGELGAHLPLTSLESAVEELNEGDSNENLAQFATELQEGDKLGVSAPAAAPVQTSDNQGKESGKN